MANRGTRPTKAQRWPISQEGHRTLTIEHAEHALALLKDARIKLDNREHPVLVALDIADAAAYIKDIKLLMEKAKEGV